MSRSFVPQDDKLPLCGEAEERDVERSDDRVSRFFACLTRFL